MEIATMSVRRMEWPDLIAAASQIRKVRTNPASYQQGEFDDMPLTGEFMD